MYLVLSFILSRLFNFFSTTTCFLVEYCISFLSLQIPIISLLFFWRKHFLFHLRESRVGLLKRNLVNINVFFCGCDQGKFFFLKFINKFLDFLFYPEVNISENMALELKQLNDNHSFILF